AAIFVPNIIYLVLIVGTLSWIFVPIVIRADASAGEGGQSEAFSHVTNFVLLLMLAAVSLAVLTARFWLGALFSGFSPATVKLAVHLTYIICPAVVFLGISGILTAARHSQHQ